MLYKRYSIALAAALLVPACSDTDKPSTPGAAGASADASADAVAMETGAPDSEPGEASAPDQYVPEAGDAPGDGPWVHDGSEDAAHKDGEEPDGSEAGLDAESSLTCFGSPPPGAPDPLPWPQYAGTCPAFAAAPSMTKLESSGTIREFIVVKPSSVAPSEKLPVVFVWHWLGGSADDAFEKLFLQEAAELHRLVMVVPKAKGDLLFRWPFLFSDSQGRIDEELKFFEDMLACVAAAYPQAVRQCVASVGVSAGALFSDQLAGSRANRIASFVSLSGGVGTTARPWPKPSRRLPGVVLWGGPTDDYQGLYDFHKGSLALEDALVGQGNFFVECVHNCGHDVPPFDAPPGGTRFDAVWRFILDHPFWVAPGTSPYLGTPLPEPFPDWCGQGKGGAVPRAEGSPC